MASTTERTDHAQSKAPLHPSTLEGEGKVEDEREYFDGLEEDIEEEKGSNLEDGDLHISSNNFNVATINNFIEKDIIKAPFYQRHYVWDIKKASLFIESILFGFPIPTIFLQDTTEGGKKRYDIVDGQQRLLTIYFFTNNIFPATDKARNLLRDQGTIKDVIDNNKSMFSEFKLNLLNLHSYPIQSKKGHRTYNGYTYEQLGEISEKPVQDNFDLTAISITAIKMIGSENCTNKIYEIYRRLNTAGVKLNPQQVRAAVYHSDFYEILYDLNKEPLWREIVDKEDASKTMADVETLLRAAAFLIHWNDYKSSMVNFLNDFSYEMTKPEQNKSAKLLKEIFLKFFKLSRGLSFLREVKVIIKTTSGQTVTKTVKRFSIPTFEVIFVAACEEAWIAGSTDKVEKITPEKLKLFLENEELTKLLSVATGGTNNLKNRIALAKKCFS